MTASTTLDDLIADFELLEDWEQRFGYVIDLGKKLPGLDPAEGYDETAARGLSLWHHPNALPERACAHRVLFGTLAGAALGLGQVSKLTVINRPSWFFTQLFRNSPWLVILFIVLLALPFEIVIFGYIISIPDWMKAVFGLSLPIMANISEIVRGAVQSVPTAQWEASESLAFTRRQTMWRIILPQCFKRMIPPWMNWYAILTMATPLCSLLGVEEIITLSRQAMEAENNHPELLVPFYSFALVLFFIYCYPIARITIALERRYAVKL